MHITHDSDIVASSGLWQFVGLSHAEFKLFQNFGKCVRGWAEGQKTVFTLLSLTRKRFDVASSNLNQFVA